ncbi:MAG: TolC family protein [Candidatus Eisenbacteria bacterium]|uniref:TolC family protein n=1 Tax=Eiseniibacteriota bacterium TaxID=2212470 RepID=A0A538SHM0_UNCEI|nr:MAG: TolC family protein [Candidatus Eisenbacteria bacterium]
MRPAANAGLLPEEGMTRNARTIFLALMISALWGTYSMGAEHKTADATSAPRGPLTIDEAVKLALANSSQIIGAEASVLDAQSGIYRSYSGILPSISADVAAALREDFESYSSTPVISGSWTFLDLSALSAWSSARSGLHSAELAFKSTRQGVALDARRKFYDVVKSIHLSRVSSQALRLSRDNERRVKALFDVGSVSRSDLLKAQVRTAQSELDSLGKHNGISVARITLATALGIVERTMGEVDTVLTAEAQAYDEAQILSEAEAARPDLKSAKADWNAARASLRAANYLRLPALFARGSWTLRGPTSTSTTTFDEAGFYFGLPVQAGDKLSTRGDADRAYTGEIGLTWNLFSGFATEGSIASSRARVMRAKDNYEALHRNLASEVEQTLLTYREVVAAYGVAQRAVESAEENMKLTQQKYNVGSATILDLIDAQVQLQQAESDIVSALAGIRVVEATIEKVRGRGD